MSTAKTKVMAGQNRLVNIEHNDDMWALWRDKWFNQMSGGVCMKSLRTMQHVMGCYTMYVITYCQIQYNMRINAFSLI